MAKTKKEFQEVKFEDIDSGEDDAGESLSNAQDSLPYGDLDDDSDIELTDLDSNILFSSDEGQKRKLENKKHRPKRRRNHRAIQDDTYDRTSAKIHKPDNSKLTITFNTETDHPTINSKSVPGEPVKHEYHDRVDWADKKSISKLNCWRNQIFFRSIGPIRESRPRWTVMEMHFLCCIVQDHLETIGGRYSKIGWECVAKTFNRVMDGRMQRIGEATTKSGAKGSHHKTKTWCLKADRHAPVRSANALQAQMERFTDSWPVKIVEDSRNADKTYLELMEREGRN